jgi:E3 ubiquitin-protein ligase CHFR
MSFKIGLDTAICTNCLPNLWFQMLFVYYNDVKPQFPKAIRERPDCWWGINCKTQINKPHSEKLNHIILQS